MRRWILFCGAALTTGLRPLSAHLQELRLAPELHGLPRWAAVTERRMQVVMRARVRQLCIIQPYLSSRRMNRSVTRQFRYIFLFLFGSSYYSDRGQCAKCYLSCKTCSGPRRDQCVTCPRGWQLAAGECHPECPEGFFKSNYGCQKCHHYCRTCKGTVG